MSSLNEDIVNVVREVYATQDFIPLHVPVFIGNEKEYLNECIDSTFVSSVGAYVNRIEKEVAEYVGAKRVVAVCNGTMGLHVALHSLGVGASDEVITQPFSFVATANAIRYTGASPVFVDISRNTLGLCPVALKKYLEANYELTDGLATNKHNGKKLKAIVPMHSFGIPCEIDRIIDVANEFNVPLVEDAAESLGSIYKGQHTGTFGKIGVYSFNGNKTITAGGGGVIVTNDEDLADYLKHLTTTAKRPHKYEYFHDEMGFNYRMPNLNAALLCAQLEKLDQILENKRCTTQDYGQKLAEIEGVELLQVTDNCISNNWLNALLFKDVDARNSFLEYSNSNGVMTRPAWELLNTLPMYSNCDAGDLAVAEEIASRLVNIPSSYRFK